MSTTTRLAILLTFTSPAFAQVTRGDLHLLRAAGEAVLTRGRRSETVLVRELPPAEAGLFLQRLIKVPTIHLLIGVGAVGLAQNIGRRYNRLKPATTQNTASGGRAEKAQVAR